MTSGALVFSSPLQAAAQQGGSVRVSVIYNNLGDADHMVSDWGYAVWIEHHHTAVLFDTGGDPDVLWQNIQHAGLDLTKLSSVVISHNHWDHTGGLSAVLEKTNYRPKVCVPHDELKALKTEFPDAGLIGVTGAAQLTEFAWTTGQLKGAFGGDTIYEQSLLVTQGDAVCVFTGCSHSGIVQIVQQAKKMMPHKRIQLVSGGFHLRTHSEDELLGISNALKELQVVRLGPSHCTGDDAITMFRKEWGENCLDLNLGATAVV